MTIAPVFDPFGLVAKHGSHDQKSHGNWARGGGKYPIGRVVAGLAIDGDYRKESDPARRFTEFWQRTYEGYGLVREAAMRVLDGKTALGGTTVGGHDDDYHSVFDMEEDGTWVNDEDGYTYGDLNQDIESAGQWVADGLRNGSTGKVLFRGTNMTQDQIDRLGIAAMLGDRADPLELGPSATSEKLKTAQHYSAGNLDANEKRVVFRFPESTKHLDLTRYSGWGKDHPEQIVAGKFKVTGVFENRMAAPQPTDDWVEASRVAGIQPHYYVNLEPVEQP